MNNIQGLTFIKTRYLGETDKLKNSKKDLDTFIRTELHDFINKLASENTLSGNKIIATLMCHNNRIAVCDTIRQLIIKIHNQLHNDNINTAKLGSKDFNDAIIQYLLPKAGQEHHDNQLSSIVDKLSKYIYHHDVDAPHQMFRAFSSTISGNDRKLLTTSANKILANLDDMINEKRRNISELAEKFISLDTNDIDMKQINELSLDELKALKWAFEINNSFRILPSLRINKAIKVLENQIRIRSSDKPQTIESNQNRQIEQNYVSEDVPQLASIASSSVEIEPIIIEEDAAPTGHIPAEKPQLGSSTLRDNTPIASKGSNSKNAIKFGGSITSIASPTAHLLCQNLGISDAQYHELTKIISGALQSAKIAHSTSNNLVEKITDHILDNIGDFMIDAFMYYDENDIETSKTFNNLIPNQAERKLFIEQIRNSENWFVDILLEQNEILCKAFESDIKRREGNSIDSEVGSPDSIAEQFIGDNIERDSFISVTIKNKEGKIIYKQRQPDLRNDIVKNVEQNEDRLFLKAVLAQLYPQNKAETMFKFRFITPRDTQSKYAKDKYKSLFDHFAQNQAEIFVDLAENSYILRNHTVLLKTPIKFAIPVTIAQFDNSRHIKCTYIKAQVIKKKNPNINEDCNIKDFIERVDAQYLPEGHPEVQEAFFNASAPAAHRVQSPEKMHISA